jgi:homoprotocatechuate degradation regulator HpaR
MRQSHVARRRIARLQCLEGRDGVVRSNASKAMTGAEKVRRPGGTPKHPRKPPRGAAAPPARQQHALPVEGALPVSLLRAREAIMLHMRPILRSHGLTEQQWRVLRTLDASAPIDKTTLAARSALLGPSLLRIVKDLEHMGLVRLVPSANNPRLSRVVLAPKGVTAVKRAAADIAAMNRLIWGRIGFDLANDLLRLLHTVESRLRGMERPTLLDPRG